MVAIITTFAAVLCEAPLHRARLAGDDEHLRLSKPLTTGSALPFFRRPLRNKAEVTRRGPNLDIEGSVRATSRCPGAQTSICFSCSLSSRFFKVSLPLKIDALSSICALGGL